MELAGYSNEKTSVCEQAVSYKQPSIEERLLQQKSRLESNLNDVNAALEALQANPEILKVMCLISKVNY